MGFSLGRTVAAAQSAAQSAPRSSSGKGGGYTTPVAVPYSDTSYAPSYSYQSPYGPSASNQVAQQYTPMFAPQATPRPQFVAQQLPSGATTYAPSYGSTYGSRPRSYAPMPAYQQQYPQQPYRSYQAPDLSYNINNRPPPRGLMDMPRREPEFMGRPKNILPYPSRMNDQFAGNEQYQALMDYQKSLEPTEEERSRLQELRSAFEGSDAFRNYQQQRRRDMAERMAGGIGGYGGGFGMFRPYRYDY